ncbi:MAG: OmpA family protein [Rubrivivax sp.]
MSMHPRFWHPEAARLARLMAATVALALSVTLAGCASPPPPAPKPTTTVTLLPDADGVVGVVRLTAGGVTQQLDVAYSSTAVTGSGAAMVSAPSRPATGSIDAVRAEHAALLQAEPSPPRSFTLYFLLDRTVLTEASKAQLPEVLRVARERKPTEITVFGHADSSGTGARNLSLSAERARVVADLLRSHDAELEPTTVQFFGDKSPLVPTAPGAAEPRNRRAEIQIL